jgi:hypothetical protein
MTQKDDAERGRRDEDRSEEAHWQVAEAGAAEEIEGLLKTQQSGDREEEWEDEAGALGRGP